MNSQGSLEYPGISSCISNDNFWLKTVNRKFQFPLTKPKSSTVWDGGEVSADIRGASALPKGELYPVADLRQRCFTDLEN